MQEYGIYGVMLVIVAEFVLSRIINSKARIRMKEQAQKDRADMERRIHDELEERHQKIVNLMNAVIGEKQVMIDDVRSDLRTANDKIFTLEVALKDASSRIDSLRERAVVAEDEVLKLHRLLEATESALGNANLRSAELALEVENLNTRMMEISTELETERQMRVSAEQRVQNLEQWNDRANADNVVLIRRVDALTTEIELRRNRIIALEEELERMRPCVERIRKEQNAQNEQSVVDIGDGAGVDDGNAGNGISSGDGTGGDHGNNGSDSGAGG